MATLNLNEKKIPSAENLRLIAQLCISLANKQSSLEDRCIAPWKSGEIYQKDISYVLHDGYIYLCSVSNNDTDFTESHWTKLSDTISELTKADIEALVNLTPEQITNLQSLIDDTSISTTHTNSSSHIYMAIQDAIAECKDNTLKQIAKKVSGSYKIANTTADIVSADYIYLLSNGTNYDLYVLVDGIATKVGDTNIELSEYVKTTDLADYMKTADADGKFATITAVDDKADKSDIPTTLPANGGNADTVNNHTVKSDVPENAVFTDTIYDDTEVKNSITEINRNLGNCFLNTGIIISNETDIKSVDDAPIGICFVSKDAVDNPFTFWSTIFTVGYNNDYKQQLAFPWARNEATMMKFRAKDNGVWTDWKIIS